MKACAIGAWVAIPTAVLIGTATGWWNPFLGLIFQIPFAAVLTLLAIPGSRK